MGWLYFHKPVGKKAVDTIKEGCGAEWIEKHFVAATATREAVFIVAKFHDPDSKVYVPDTDGTVRTLLVYAIKNVPNASDGYNFGYKDMAETMGPYGWPAPASIIAQCSPLQDPIGPLPDSSSLKSTRDYRAMSAKAAAQKAFKRGLKPGAKIKLAEPSPVQRHRVPALHGRALPGAWPQGHQHPCSAPTTACCAASPPASSTAPPSRSEDAS